MNMISVDEVRTLVLDSEEMEKLSDYELEALTFDKAMEIISTIIDETPKDKETTPLDNITWWVRWSYVLGFGKALKAYSAAIEDFVIQASQG